MTQPTRVNPLSRLARRKRLNIAIKGPSGSGKSRFVASMGALTGVAGIGKLAVFDTERKMRLISGSDGSVFDGIEVQHPDELPDFVEWAINGEGREQHYSMFAIDSWDAFYGPRRAEMLRAIRAESGDPTATLSEEQERNLNAITREVLDKLCFRSDALGVVITTTIADKRKETEEENEEGRVLPVTQGGLSYFVDVVLESELRVIDFEPQVIMTVVKTNLDALPLGTEFVRPTFRTVYEHAFGPIEDVAPAEAAAAPSVTTYLPEPPVLTVVRTLADLRALAARHGISDAQLRTGARAYVGKDHLETLTPEDMSVLMAKIEARYAAAEASEPSAAAVAVASAPRPARARR
jgi:energy-coupling factor transporter ATP-binding protein EcfA2